MDTGVKQELPYYIIGQVKRLRSSVDDHRGFGTVLRRSNGLSINLKGCHVRYSLYLLLK